MSSTERTASKARSGSDLNMFYSGPSDSVSSGSRSAVRNAHAALSDYHDCSGCIFFVDEFGTLQLHRSNQTYFQDRVLFKQFAQTRDAAAKEDSPVVIDEKKPKIPVPITKLCPACESIKVIYPKATSQALRKTFLLKSNNVQTNNMSTSGARTQETQLFKANSVNLQAYCGHSARQASTMASEDASYEAMMLKLHQNSGNTQSFRLSDYYK
jgi:hypothetical protein